MNIESIKPYPNNTFKSKICFIDSKTFYAKTKSLSSSIREVPYPWTIETMKVGKNLYTTELLDCIGGCIISNKSAAMFHLATRTPEQAAKDKVLPFDIKNIEQKLNSKLDLTKQNNLHGFIIGGLQIDKNRITNNVKCFNELIDLFNKYNIDCTVFGPRKDVHYFGRYSILYEKENDTLYITNSLTNSKDLRGSGVEMSIINNKVNYYTYQYINNRDVMYSRTEHLEPANEYFKSQFHRMSISKFDTFV